MRVVSKIDEQGFFVEDVLLADNAALPSSEHVESRPPQGFHRPKWDGTSWVEGKPEEEIVESKRAGKIAEIHSAAVEELSPLFTSEHGKDELIFLLAAHIKSMAGAQADPRLVKVEEVGQKALAKRDRVEAATSLEELEAIRWEEP
jgi:hypothetical protein